MELIMIFMDSTASGTFRKSSKGDNPKRAHLVTLREPGWKGATAPVPNVQQGAFRRNLRAFWPTAISMNEMRAP